MLQYDFIGVQCQMQFLAQEATDMRHKPPQIIRVGMNDIEIIHITAVIPASQFPFDKIVEYAEINIAEKLRSEVSDRQPMPFRGIKQAFRTGQTVPTIERPSDKTVVNRLV